MAKSILLTRPQVVSERWAVLLAEHGFGSIIEPLLFIEPTFTSRPEGIFQAVLITSANAPDMLDALQDRLADLFSLPCFCVGTLTGEAARRLGFEDVRATSSDSLATAHLIVSTLPNNQIPILHISGDIVDTKARDLLTRSGFGLEQWAVYRARASEDLSPQVCKLLEKAEISAIPVFSPRSAQILVSLLEKKQLSRHCHKILAIGLSQAVADVLQQVPWRKLTVAQTPSEESVLASLQSELSMTEVIPEKTFEPSKKIAAPPRKPSSFIRLLLSIILIGILVVLVIRYEASQKEVATVDVPSDMAVLEKRVDSLETQLTAMTEIAQATPEANSGNEELQEQIKTLEARLTQVENLGAQTNDAAHKWAAIILAFLDLRDAARSGRVFSHELDAMRIAGSDDPEIAKALAKLEPMRAEAIPSFEKLRSDFKAQEQSLSAPDFSDNDLTFWGRLRSAFHPLISVHPLSNPIFSGLDQALEEEDGGLITQKFQALPPKTQEQLATWQENLARRIMLNDAVNNLGGHLTGVPKDTP